ncbi:MAG: hypothetical protein GQ468_00890 [Candidatus Scalindua sp.]|nr:hypothetical protein [Candidatus Scalindua sp.]
MIHKWRKAGKTTLTVEIYDLCTKITNDGLEGVVAIAEGSTCDDLIEVFGGLQRVYDRRVEYEAKSV